jgi:hypothetical protein
MYADVIIILDLDPHSSAFMEHGQADKNSSLNIVIKPKDSKIYHGQNKDFF